MKAIVYRKYGAAEVLRLEDVKKPVPKDNEILVRIAATAVNSGDFRLRKADPWAVRLFFGLTKPRKQILGSVFSGTIEAVGQTVTRFKTGEEVFGATGMSFGAYAEYKCLAEDGIIASKPANINHLQSAVIPFGGTTALHFLRKANIQKGQKVLIYGASGAIGTAAIQLARHFGAHVTAVCGTSNLELVRSLGADEAIDYTKEDFTGNGQEYDVVYETVNKLPFSKSIQSVRKGGILILGAAGFRQIMQGSWAAMTGKRKIISGLISQNAVDIAFLKSLVEEGRYSAVVDRNYPLDQMAEAHRYAEKGHKKGNVGIAVHAEV